MSEPYFPHMIPVDFRRCVAADCKAAELCLRHQAFAASNDADKDFWVINPKAARPEDGTDCPHYCNAAKVRMARGFKHALLSVPHGNVKSICDEISQYFCQRNYYHMRRGDRPMTPAEQEIVSSVLEKYGACTPIEFDAYYDDYLWE